MAHVCNPSIQEAGKKKEDCCDFKDSLGYMLNSRIAWAKNKQIWTMNE